MRIRKPSFQNIIMILTYVVTIGGAILLIPSEGSLVYLQFIVVLTMALVFVALYDLSVNNTRLSNMLYYVGFMILAGIMAFRAQTGIDDWQYRRLYLNAADASFFSYLSMGSSEIGYKILNFFLYQICGDNYNMAQAIITFFTFYLWAVAIKKYKSICSIPMMVFLLWTHYYLLVMGAGLVRIFIAIPIVLYALDFIYEQKWKKYFIYVLIASLFHLSALFMLILLVFAIKSEWFYKHWRGFVLSLIVIIPLAFIVVARIIVPLLATNKYSEYAVVNSLSISIGSFDMLPILIIGYYFYQFVEPENKKRYIINLVLISLSIIISIFSSMVSIGRLIYYANLGIVVLIPELCKIKRNVKGKKIAISVLIAYATVYMMHTGFLNSGINENLFSYSTFFE